MADDDVDDYMTMSFDDDAAKPKESSLQRRLRLQRERRERAHPPSKAELARAAEAERTAALNRSLFAGGGGDSTAKPGKNEARPPPSKGLAMMARMGFVVGQPLGKRREDKPVEGTRAEDAPAAVSAAPVNDDRLTEPIPIKVKRGRAGLGAATEEEEGGGGGGGDEGPDAKRVKGGAPPPEFDPLAYRDRMAQEREAARLERIVHAAQGVARRMAGEEEADGVGGGKDDDVDLCSVNVLWRGLVRDRRVAECERRQRHESRQLLDARLRGTARDNDDEDDNDDRLARGEGPAHSFLDGGLRTEIRDDDEDEHGDEKVDEKDKDEELAAFEALPARERLQKIVDWLRTEHRYCFWCKYAYPDDEMDGCPGRTEEDHD